MDVTTITTDGENAGRSRNEQAVIAKLPAVIDELIRDAKVGS